MLSALGSRAITLMGGGGEGGLSALGSWGHHFGEGAASPARIITLVGVGGGGSPPGSRGHRLGGGGAGGGHHQAAGAIALGGGGGRGFTTRQPGPSS